MYLGWGVEGATIRGFAFVRIEIEIAIASESAERSVAGSALSIWLVCPGVGGGVSG